MKKVFSISIPIISLCIALVCAILLFRSQGKIKILNQEINQLVESNKEDEKKVEELYNTIAGLRVEKTTLQNQIDSLREQLEKYEPDPFKEAIKNLDPKVFVTDPENYTPTDHEIRITAEQAAVIAQKGFEESAKRIAGEGADNIKSQKIEIKQICANNYFTRQGMEYNKTYSEIFRTCYIFTRTNEMKCGVEIYVDATTGLIIGGGAFGD